MSSSYNSAAIDFEINLIKSEANFYFEFIFRLIKQKSAPILIFEILPYLSLFIVESSNYIQNAFPNYAKEISLEYEQIICNSRMRIKFFDDTINQVSGVFEFG
ncbi:hypothetical protein VB713_23865 [Anabaena cylindrica UHCC 0172]|uniref:hypothetical protein n=1 Tax=Anabaena cylindrica TaxID=1165 RepID=UPI002B221517|nr:hypothetical protein [Anabaena cylindrica]MEA5553980.1 hypothetical protein [Anabaena cylindrica UHCC 0172]